MEYSHPGPFVLKPIVHGTIRVGSSLGPFVLRPFALVLMKPEYLGRLLGTFIHSLLRETGGGP